MANFYLTAATSDTATMLATLYSADSDVRCILLHPVRPQKKREKEDSEDERKHRNCR